VEEYKNLKKWNAAYADQARGSESVRDLLSARVSKEEKFIQTQLDEIKKLEAAPGASPGTGLSDKTKQLI